MAADHGVRVFTVGFGSNAGGSVDIDGTRLPVIGLTVRHDPREVAQAHKLAVSELVAKFDRRGLLAALAELDGMREEAA